MEGEIGGIKSQNMIESKFKNILVKNEPKQQQEKKLKRSKTKNTMVTANFLNAIIQFEHHCHEEHDQKCSDHEEDSDKSHCISICSHSHSSFMQTKRTQNSDIERKKEEMYGQQSK